MTFLSWSPRASGWAAALLSTLAFSVASPIATLIIRAGIDPTQRNNFV